MKIENQKSIIESLLFVAGRVVKVSEIATVLEITPKEAEEIVASLKSDFESSTRGIEIIKVNDGYQFATKRENYDYVIQIMDNRSKPSLSTAAMETLSIIAYNPKITRAGIEAIRGVSTDGTIYRLMEYHLIEEAGKMDAPGKPTMYKVSEEFFKMFGLGALDELPELPRYKLDENEQIVLEDMDGNVIKDNEESVKNE